MTGTSRRRPSWAILMLLALVTAGCGGDPELEAWDDSGADGEAGETVESCAADGSEGSVCTADSTITYRVDAQGVLDLRDPDSDLYQENSITTDGSYTVTVLLRLRNEDGGWVDNGSTYDVNGSVVVTSRLHASEGADCTGVRTQTYTGSGAAKASFLPRPDEGTAVFYALAPAQVRDETVVGGHIDNPYGEDLTCEGVVGTTGTTVAEESISFDCPAIESGVVVPFEDGTRTVDLSCTDEQSLSGATATYTVSGSIAFP